MALARRRFLQAFSGAASLGFANWSPLRNLVAAGEQPAAPQAVRFSADLEPLVRLIEETPREQYLPVRSLHPRMRPPIFTTP